MRMALYYLAGLGQRLLKIVGRATSKIKEQIKGKPFLALVAVFLFMVCITIPFRAYASAFDDAIGAAMLLVAKFLYWICTLLNDLCIALTSILISFAKYNTFVNATPVNIGWKLVRDVVNMFFIVVLLLIAFGTIIGYKAFHYKDHLHKLLLMAVLINFSKTIVGVLIDFSQVITLTFVTAFQNSAFGNFAKAFKYDQLAKWSDHSDLNTEATPPAADLPNTIIALMFAIVILVMIASVIFIMMMYFIVRIVLLWVLLILSPIPFFAYALPSNIKSRLGNLTGEWWSKLSSMLTGGPIVAFFLWLTLATIQGAADPFPGMYTKTGGNEKIAFTELSDASNLSSLIVAMVMLLIGVQQAVSVSSQMAPQLGNIASKIKSSGGPAMWIGRGAARATRYGASKGGKLLLSRYGGNIGGSLVSSGSNQAAKGGLINSIVGGAKMKLGRSMAKPQLERRAAISKGIKEELRSIKPSDRAQYLAAKRNQVFTSKDAKLAYNMELASAVLNPAYISSQRKSYEKSFIDNEKNSQAYLNENDPEKKKLLDGEIAQKARAHGEIMQKRDASKALADAKKAAIELEDSEALKKITETYEKSPDLQQDLGLVYSNFVETISDPHSLKGVKVDAFKDSGTFLAYMKAGNLINDKGELADNYEKSDAWKELVKSSDRNFYAQGHIKDLTRGPQDIGGGVMRDGKLEAQKQLNAMNVGISEEQRAAGLASRMSVSKSVDGKNMVYANATAGGNNFRIAMSEQPMEIKNIDDLTSKLPAVMQSSLKQALSDAGLTGPKLESFIAGFKNKPMTEAQANHIEKNASFYTSPPMAAPGVMNSGDHEKNISMLIQGQSKGIRPPSGYESDVVSKAVEMANSRKVEDKIMGASALSNLDTSNLASDTAMQKALVDAFAKVTTSAGGGRQIKMDVSALGKAYVAANASGNDSDMMERLEKMIGGIRKAGAQITKEASSGETITAEKKDILAIVEALNTERNIKRAGRGR